MNSILDKLTENLYKPLVFYIPKSIVPEQNLYLIENNKDLERIFNKLFLIKLDGAGYDATFHACLFETLQKETILDDNIFMLLQEKQKLGVDPFYHLLEKYQQELRNYIWITDWLKDNLQATFEGQNEHIEEDVEVSLEFQHQYLKDHQKEVQKTFKRKPKKKIDLRTESGKGLKKDPAIDPESIKQFIEGKFNELSSKLVTDIDNPIKKEPKPKEENIKQALKFNKKTEKTSFRERRKKILEELDTEEYLLRTVFNKKT